MKQIDQWENDSIEKIHRAANHTRKQLIDIIETHTNKLKEDLEEITQELKKGRNGFKAMDTKIKSISK